MLLAHHIPNFIYSSFTVVNVSILLAVYIPHGFTDPTSVVPLILVPLLI